MKRIIFYILFVFSFSILAQNKPVFIQASSPGFIPVDSTFEISLVVRLIEEDVEELNFFILANDDIELNSVIRRHSETEFETLFSESEFPGYYGKAYELFYTNDDSLIYNHPIFQLVLNLSVKGLEKTEIGFGIELVKNKEEIKYYSSFEEQSYYEKFIPVVPISLYKPQSSSGNSLILGNESELSFSFPNEKFDETLLFEFWGRIKCGIQKGLFIYEMNSGDTLFSFSCNRYQMLTIPERSTTYLARDVFIGGYYWNHYSIEIDPDKMNLNFYINGNHIYTVPVENPLILSNLIFGFKNISKFESLEIDNLKLWHFNNKVELSFANKNYNSYAADSSRILLNLSFDNEESLNNLANNENIVLTRNNLSFIKSSAPIFSRIPKLSINAHTKYYEIKWQNIDTEQIESYEVERSVGGSEYVSIYYTPSENDQNKVYTFIDYKTVSNEIIYYRIKQTLKDDSFIYSESIKIGKGKIDYFILDQNYPNPFNPETNISVDILETTEFQITVYDLVGNVIKKIHSGILSKGMHNFSFNGSNLPTGIYFFEVKSPFSTHAIKMILAK